MGHVEFEGPAGHVLKMWKFKAGAQARGGANKSSAVTLFHRTSQVVRAGEGRVIRGSRVNSEEASEAGGGRGVTWTSVSPAVKWEQVRGMT